MENQTITKPIYQQIATDIASRIIKDEFFIGSKLFGRSVLASYYNVSPETIRRAIKLLEDVSIVAVKPGAGIVINSKEEAYKYIQKFQVVDSITSIRKEIKSLSEEKIKIEKSIENSINELIKYTETFKNTNPFAPFEIEVMESSKLLGKSISEVNFWQNTGATIIGIRRNGSVILSSYNFV